ncbi:MAG: site-specific DNA-methyltransferase [Deltaproteobacteria bacterium]|nr:site-specific DNA-methyltransferase [Deltaproteobacteria bacterium]
MNQINKKKVIDIIVEKNKKVKEAIYQVRRERFHDSVKKASQATARADTDILSGIEVSVGDVFKLGEHILICADNTDPAVIEYLRLFKFSFSFADPPYNLGLADYDRAEFTWMQDYLTEISDIVAVAPGINNIKFFLKNTEMAYKWLLICHVKNLHSGCAIGYTHYYPVFLFSNLKSINFGIKDLFDITLPPMPEEDREIANKRQKPSGLLTYILNSFTKESDFIIDPFAGSGQTLMVCEALGRKCITVEILPDMVRAIIHRFENKFGIKAVKINTLQVKNTYCV